MTHAGGTATMPEPRPESRKPSADGADYARLTERIRDAGLLARRPRYYALRFGLVGAMLVGAWTAFALIGDSWWQIPIAVLLAFVFGQLALVSHDLAHRQVFTTRRPTETAGRIAGNLGIGMSYSWWTDKHNRHHANPNHEELDPDVAPDILLWSTRQSNAAYRRIPRLIGRWQAFLFFPLLTLEGFNLHVASARALFKPSTRRRGLEALTLGAHLIGYLVVVFLVLSPAKAIVFIAIHQGLFGIYLGSIFAPNHKGMPTLTGSDRPDFLRRQVLTSRNVRGGPVINMLMGGLNYQIEHHLYPSMPSPHLPRAQRIVRDYCAEIDVPYHETGLVSSYAEALRHMHEVGAPLRRGSRPQPV